MATQTLAFAESSHALGDARHDCVSSISLLSAVFTDTLASNEEALVSAVADLGLAPNSGT